MGYLCQKLTFTFPFRRTIFFVRWEAGTEKNQYFLSENSPLTLIPWRLSPAHPAAFGMVANQAPCAWAEPLDGESSARAGSHPVLCCSSPCSSSPRAAACDQMQPGSCEARLQTPGKRLPSASRTFLLI